MQKKKKPKKQQITRKLIHSSFENLLGSRIHRLLKWDKHTDCLTSKLNTVIFLLRNLVHCVSENILKIAYFGLFHSILSYAILSWRYSASADRIIFSQCRGVLSK